ncbi:MAG: hypothetical protein Q8P62_00305 [Candidatus Peregrinibacteria bacterium]|nr:hypothetical protein [Candidatus Peregrinibacteria bacterium]
MGEIKEEQEDENNGLKEYNDYKLGSGDVTTLRLITLKNGTQVLTPALMLTMKLLILLAETHPKILEKFAKSCKGTERELFPQDEIAILRRYNLLPYDSTNIHPQIKAIVASATEIQGNNVILVNPKATIN